MMLPYSDMDHSLWIVASAALIVLVATLTLAFNYNHFDPPRDLLTISEVAAAYFVAAVGKRIIRGKQRRTRENKETT